MVKLLEKTFHSALCFFGIHDPVVKRIAIKDRFHVCCGYCGKEFKSSLSPAKRKICIFQHYRRVSPGNDGVVYTIKGFWSDNNIDPDMAFLVNSDSNKCVGDGLTEVNSVFDISEEEFKHMTGGYSFELIGGEDA